MKRNFTEIFFSGYPLFAIALVFWLGAGCSDKCQVTNSYVYYEPVYSTTAEIKAAVAYKAPQPLNQLGKIYFKDQILYINEVGKGIHVIDNANPKSPKPIGFINIPGNFDLAIIDNALYADSFIDLVVFDVSNVEEIKEVNRIERLFNHYQSMGFISDPVKGIVTDWKKVETISISEDDCNTRFEPWGGFYYERGIALADFAASSFSSKAAINPAGTTGIGGSLARFTISFSHLYALDGANLDVVDVSKQTTPKPVKEVPLSWDVETLFPHGTNLFMGSRTGMYIYDLANPAQPAFVSHFQHVRSCDPVVVEGNYAYVTLRSGNACGNTESQLQVINIENVKAPSLVKSYPLVNPYGLGIDDHILFICDGTDGLKVYDAKDVNQIGANRLAHYQKINALDIIPFQNVAMMIGADGLYQYDYSDIKNVKLLSKLEIVKP